MVNFDFLSDKNNTVYLYLKNSEMYKKSNMFYEKDIFLRISNSKNKMHELIIDNCDMKQQKTNKK